MARESSQLEIDLVAAAVRVFETSWRRLLLDRSRFLFCSEVSLLRVLFDACCMSTSCQLPCFIAALYIRFSEHISVGWAQVP